MQSRAVACVCGRGVEVPAVYVNHDGEPGLALLPVEGRMVSLVAETPRSGVRFDWPSDRAHYLWWTRGEAATLYGRDRASGEERPLLSGCRSGG